MATELFRFLKTYEIVFSLNRRVFFEEKLFFFKTGKGKKFSLECV